MRHLKLFTCIASLAMTLVFGGKALAQDVNFTIDKYFIKPGSTATLTMKLANTERITAVTGRINLPEGLSFVTTKNEKEYVCGKAERTKNALDISLVGATTKSAAFAVAMNVGVELPAGSGDLLTFDVVADDSFAARDSIELVDLKGSITVNGVTSSYTQENFKTPVYNEDFMIAASQITVPDFSIAPGETKKVNFDLSFDKDRLQSLQYDLILPEGLSIVRNEDGSWPYEFTERTPNYLVATNGLHVAIVPNPFNISDDDLLLFQGTEGTLFTFEIHADETFDADSEILFYNFMACTETTNETASIAYYAPDWTVKVTKSSTSGIDSVNGEDVSGDSRPDGIYSISGYKTDKLMKGLNIVVKNGKATKVVVK